MIINKTSVLPRLCVRLIASIMKEDAAEMINYVEQLGAAFQIQDDLIAIKSDIYAKERGILAEDIHEGKRTLIVSHAYRKSNMNSNRFRDEQAPGEQEIARPPVIASTPQIAGPPTIARGPVDTEVVMEMDVKEAVIKYDEVNDIEAVVNDFEKKYFDSKKLMNKTDNCSL